MFNIILYILIALTTLTGGLAYQNLGDTPEPVGLATYFPIQLNSVDTAADGECLSYQSATSKFEWIACGGGGSTLHVDGTGFVYPQTGDYHSAPYYVGTTTGSTFVGLLSSASTTVNSTLVVTGTLTADLTGNADTATALAGNGANCAAGEIALGVDASGAVEGCYEPTEGDITDLSHTVARVAGTHVTLAGNTFNVDDALSSYTDDLSHTADTNLTEEEVEDFVGGMLGGTETLISVTYVDGTNDIDFVVTGTLSSYTDDLTHLATAITDNLIINADLNIDNEASNNDILTYDSTGDNFAWNTPAELITAGDNISWTGATLNVTGHTADEVGTLTTGDLCVNDGSAVNCTVNTEGELETALDSLDVVTVTASDISEANLYTILSDVSQFWEAGDALSSGTITSGFGNIDNGSSNLDSDGTVTFNGTVNVGAGTSFELPNGASPTVNADGEIAIDTTSGQLIYYSTDKKVITEERHMLFGFPTATTTGASATTTFYLAPAGQAQTFTEVRCDSNSFVGVSIYDGTNRMNYFEASSTIGLVALDTNNTFTEGEARRVDIGSSTAITNLQVSCTATYAVTAD